MEIVINTQVKQGAINITDQINEKISSGKSCLIYCPHTTSSIIINEGNDEDVIKDFFSALKEIVPKLDFLHMEGNSSAHIKSILCGSSVQIPIKSGKLNLGRWQKVFFLEFDGPRKRKIIIEVT